MFGSSEVTFGLNSGWQGESKIGIETQGREKTVQDQLGQSTLEETLDFDCRILTWIDRIRRQTAELEIDQIGSKVGSGAIPL